MCQVSFMGKLSTRNINLDMMRLDTESGRNPCRSLSGHKIEWLGRESLVDVENLLITES